MQMTQHGFTNAIEHEARRLGLSSPLGIGGVVFFDIGGREVSASLFVSDGHFEGELAGSSDELLSMLKGMSKEGFAGGFWSKCQDIDLGGELAYDGICSLGAQD